MRFLTVVDWTVDPYAVVAALRRRAAREPATFTLVVPAWLHGLDWAGDPTASVPCAERRLEKLAELSARAGLDVEVAGVGDPDVMAAISDALDGRDAAGILLFERSRRLRRHPFDLVHRAQRTTGLASRRIEIARAARGHCDAEALLAA